MIEELRERIGAICREPKLVTPLPRIALMRADAPTPASGVLYDPVACFAAQGRKTLMVADRAYSYDSGAYMVTAVGLPVVAGITEASPAAPYLAVRLRLDAGILAGLLLELPGVDGPRTAGIGTAPFGPDLMEPVLRLVRLLDRPQDAAALAPMVEREILYRLLCGPLGPMLRQVAVGDTRLAQVGRVLSWMRENYHRPVRIEALARLAAMSPATLHRHFRAITGLSPLQYQKQVRLHEARRRMLAQQADARGVGFAVGYESASQFSREYARLFGAPPLRDAERLRSAGEPVPVPAP